MITSPRNKQIKMVQKLHHKKGRAETGLFILEGRHLLWEALAVNYPLHKIFYAPESFREDEDAGLLQAVKKAGVELIEVNAAVMQKLSDTETPQSWLALAKIPGAVVKQRKAAVIFDRLQDPGNVGTIIRTGLAFGIRTFYFLKGTVDPYSPKVVRASQGAILKADLLRDIDWFEVKSSFETWGIPLYAADPGGDLHPEQVAWQDGFGLILGQEGSGVSPEIFREVKKIRIPQKDEVESLNVAVAAGILLYAAAGL